MKDGMELFSLFIMGLILIMRSGGGEAISALPDRRRNGEDIICGSARLADVNSGIRINTITAEKLRKRWMNTSLPRTKMSGSICSVSGQRSKARFLTRWKRSHGRCRPTGTDTISSILPRHKSISGCIPARRPWRILLKSWIRRAA